MTWGMGMLLVVVNGLASVLGLAVYAAGTGSAFDLAMGVVNGSIAILVLAVLVRDELS